MKDKKIREKLNIYADSLGRNERILYGAYREMDARRQEAADRVNDAPAYGRRGWKYAFAAVAVVIIIVIAVVLSNSGGGGSPPPLSYTLNSLKTESVSFENFENLPGAVYLTDEVEEFDGKFYTYTDKETGEIYAAAAKYKIVRNGSVDEVIVTIDYKNGLKDYSDIKPSDDKPVIKKNDVYEKGEYYSALSKSDGETAYYITVMSPTEGAAEYYENIFL